MYLDTFKDVNRYKPIEQKVCLLVQTMELVGDRRVHACDAFWRKNKEEHEYYVNEKKDMEERASWLMDEILREIKNSRHLLAKRR